MANNPIKATHHAMPKVTSIPLITLKLPSMYAYNSNPDLAVRVELEQALNMSQFYVEDGAVVPRNQQIIYSRGVLIFFVPRRAHTLNISKLIQPHQAMFHRLPRTVAGFDRLNDIEVDFKENLTLRNNEHSYALKSVVVCDINTNIANEAARDGVVGPKLITGSSAIVRKLKDEENNHIDPTNYHYNPRLASIKEYNSVSNKIIENTPITLIQEDSADPLEDFRTKAAKRGTIFIYEMESGMSASYLLDPIVF
jgi:hypothetical protein